MKKFYINLLNFFEYLSLIIAHEQLLLERETAVLREESGSGDDSPDTSKQSQQQRSKPRNSGARGLHGRYSSHSSNRFANSLDSDGALSAAARNTAGSLGSLHDLTQSDSRASASAVAPGTPAASHTCSGRGTTHSKSCNSRGQIANFSHIFQFNLNIIISMHWVYMFFFFSFLNPILPEY